ncbi:cation diffusion facilitator family transporter [Alkalicoccus daliensis]|uniref:Cation diffusion facilitator family transporter n=1 Tax=Alkalicoccus daliensis TaxID=745820 RepID=A0A1H0BKJ0_9BACI|nr:cation diffusion facilitator family transporter [Alkalicoccus daliensis]SDN46111.1 cation diffusion facilitator family transporter [Alkalicoccus daliensis]
MTEINADRYKKVQFGAWIGILGNALLAIVKGIVGLAADSRALVADALHSASDVVSSIAVLIGVRAAQQPPDEDHPYGHGKAETVTAIIVSVLLIIVGIEVAVNSFTAMFSPESIPGIWAVYAAMFSILLKELMFQYKFKLGKKYKSDALIADAWHHRSDVFSSIAVLAGVGAAIAGGALGFNQAAIFDPIASVIVAAFIIRMGWKLGAEAIHQTIDHVLHEEDSKWMMEAAHRVPDVLSVDELLAREHGHYVIVDIKISVHPYITVEEGHAIGKKVKAELMKYGYVRDVRVHINPFSEKEE